jgi:hypothetical protein
MNCGIDGASSYKSPHLLLAPPHGLNIYSVDSVMSLNLIFPYVFECPVERKIRSTAPFKTLGVSIYIRNLREYISN